MRQRHFGKKDGIKIKVIPKKIKQQIIMELKSLLKYYLVNEFEQNGYDFNKTLFNTSRTKEAKMILKTINSIQQDEDIDKEKLKCLLENYEKFRKK